MKLHSLASALVFGTIVVLGAAQPALADSEVISQTDLLTRLEQAEPPLVLDVRTQKEFATGHVPGARNVPVQELRDSIEQLRSEATEGKREVVVYCERGGRAALAEGLLIEAGFSAVRHLQGDMSGWRGASLPIEKPESDAPEK